MPPSCTREWLDGEPTSCEPHPPSPTHDRMTDHVIAAIMRSWASGCWGILMPAPVDGRVGGSTWPTALMLLRGRATWSPSTFYLQSWVQSVHPLAHLDHMTAFNRTTAHNNHMTAHNHMTVQQTAPQGRGETADGEECKICSDTIGWPQDGPCARGHKELPAEGCSF